MRSPGAPLGLVRAFAGLQMNIRRADTGADTGERLLVADTSHALR
jgi:hypothetical protein